MKESTKKQLEEAMNGEFKVTELNDFGIPKEVIETARKVIDLTNDIAEVMADSTKNDFDTFMGLDEYQTIKYVLLTDALVKLCDVSKSMAMSLVIDRELINEVCTETNQSVGELRDDLMFKQVMGMLDSATKKRPNGNK